MSKKIPVNYELRTFTRMREGKFDLRLELTGLEDSETAIALGEFFVGKFEELCIAMAKEDGGKLQMIKRDLGKGATDGDAKAS